MNEELFLSLLILELILIPTGWGLMVILWFPKLHRYINAKKEQTHAINQLETEATFDCNQFEVK